MRGYHVAMRRTTPSCRDRRSGQIVVGYALACLVFATFNLVDCKCAPAPRTKSESNLTRHASVQTSRLPTAADGNFVLYVSNQSSANPLVDIETRIDGRLAVRGKFRYKDGHSWAAYQFDIPRGEHVLTVISRKGSATREEHFEVTGKHWAVVNYFFSPGKKGIRIEPTFTFHMQDKPISFD